MVWPIIGLAMCWFVAGPAGSARADTRQQPLDLSSVSLEQLSSMEIKVTSVAKKGQDLWLAPAAVYVITKNDIAHSSASSIPELLRVVPGLQVAQVDATVWAVTARGFNGELASKLLVLVDGRTLYSEIYSGVHWDDVDLPLEQIDRIEVIRGPGAAVWGTNAVNGVINIITDKTSVHRGPMVSGGTSRIAETATLGYSGPIGSRADYRGYARYVDRRPFDLASGMQTFDGGGAWRLGGRVDWQKSSQDALTVNGDFYKGRFRAQMASSPNGPGIMDDYDTDDGGYALGRWEHQTERSQTALQAYYDQQSREEIGAATRTRTGDIEYQTHLALAKHDLVWGAGLRLTADHLGGTTLLSNQPDYTNYLVSGFLQDDLALIPHHLTLTLGAKIQTGTLAGFQAQPSIRILFAPDHSDSIWAAVSRAAVAPSIMDKLMLPLSLGTVEGLPLQAEIEGGPNFKPETVLAYEAGYRRRLARQVTLDVATFFNSSRKILSQNVEGVDFVPVPSPHLFATILFQNGFKAKSGGVEATATWNPWSALALRGNYAWMEVQTIQVDPGIVALVNGWNAPRNAFTGLATWQMGRGWTADGLVSRIGNVPTAPIPSFDPSTPQAAAVTAAYTRVDANLTRKLGRAFAWSAGGTNLLSPRHVEFGTVLGYVTPAYVPRSLFVKGTLTF
jgi:iron complex outermembrane receptor protein